ncbi:MAG TPA: hypothetical protein PKC24_01125 [Cyclobacteriaceae bacterium]|nr:hypothetical protein [Cyclobacteriaceae bacterium]
MRGYFLIGKTDSPQSYHYAKQNEPRNYFSILRQRIGQSLAWKGHVWIGRSAE